MVSTKLVPLLFVAVLLSSFASHAAENQAHWVGSWAASQQLPEAANALAPGDLHDATLRQIVHLSVGGSELCVRLSNRFGVAPLHFTVVHIARPVSPASDKIIPGTDQALTFSGATDITVPAGADYVSDPVAYPMPALSDLAITLHIAEEPMQQTGHPGSRATSYLVHGNQVSAASLPNAKKVEHWYFIAGVDVSTRVPAAVVILGDSITDGHGATVDGNNRWPDLLAKRMQTDPNTRTVAVLNQGTGGNRLLLDGLGPNALARFDHDVLAQAGIRCLVVLEGINDLGMLTRDGDVPRAAHDALVHRIDAAYEQMVTRAHAHQIEVVGATLLPFAGSLYYRPGPATEADRQAINQWIRAPGHFDAVIDFDRAMRDPEHPDQLLPAFDSGDHLHPSLAGYAAMADAVPLSIFYSLVSGPASGAVAASQGVDVDTWPLKLVVGQMPTQPSGHSF